uniref:Probable cysteine protease ATG4 n=1 Tax=Komagataella pastoris TaxID=4922 RepID=ATG4_PICPA|nr:RecName: Full=Probable cysteine protease ATG4; AltName: Full=Autophagy-related protein 4; AltName: Full=Pexophagy zeocin-resistant mutant protein 8 [Komagataella pastoris]AAL25849.1 Paz8 [Komagataella pastoris]
MYRFLGLGTHPNDDQNKIHVLGRQYDPIKTQETEGKDLDLNSRFQQVLDSIKDGNKKSTTYSQSFIDDVYSKIWLTYRAGFPPIARDKDSPTFTLGALLRGQFDFNEIGFTSDAGWGCMIRTSQSLLANALLFLHLGRDWVFKAKDPANVEHDRIISWFVDIPDEPFSIHNFVQQGIKCCDKKPGEWFGPSAASRAIKNLCKEYPPCGLRVYFSSDCGDVYDTEVRELAYGDSDTFTPILVLLGIRLGVEKVNLYIGDLLRECLSLKQSVGISGRKTSFLALLSIGFQGDYLFYLIPTFPKKALTFGKHGEPVHRLQTKKTDENAAGQYPVFKYWIQIMKQTMMTAMKASKTTASTLKFFRVLMSNQSTHQKVTKLHLSHMDPSMLIGFLITSEDDFNDWKENIGKKDPSHKIVHITETKVSESTSNFQFNSLRSNSIADYDNCSGEDCDSAAIASDSDDFVDLAADFAVTGLEPRTHTGVDDETSSDYVQHFPIRRFSQPVIVSREDVVPTLSEDNGVIALDDKMSGISVGR